MYARLWVGEVGILVLSHCVTLCESRSHGDRVFARESTWSSWEFGFVTSYHRMSHRVTVSIELSRRMNQLMLQGEELRGDLEGITYKGRHRLFPIGCGSASGPGPWEIRVSPDLPDSASPSWQ